MPPYRVTRRLRRLGRFGCVLALVAFGGCGRVQQEADTKFGDQHFKTAVALIELHRVRYGAYPFALSELRFLGDWDSIALSAVEYQRLDEGYRLNLVRGWRGASELTYPPEFWQGLGVRESNVKRAAPAT